MARRVLALVLVSGLCVSLGALGWSVVKINVLEDRLERQRVGFEADIEETQRAAVAIALALSNVPCDVYSNDRSLRAAIEEVRDTLDAATGTPSFLSPPVTIQTPSRCP